MNTFDLTDSLPGTTSEIMTLRDSLRLALAIAENATDVAEHRGAGRVTIAELRGQIRQLEEVL